ncbi:MAG TPA: excinuclease ABC subunit UvrB [Gammaproteobacteria bacterium]|nr:excinuclease ABC subunit UvrB [Gammaproteobacteria bacterium]
MSQSSAHKPSVQASPAFRLAAPFAPAGDQPQAIDALAASLRDGARRLTLHGVTGSGKTFTAASVIARTARPTLLMTPNKTLATQMYQSLRSLFPDSAVEYFVSYYDYYQPESYLPSTDTYIDKSSVINREIERLRLSATHSLLERRDTIVVASVSCIYGLGAPEVYRGLALDLRAGERLSPEAVMQRLVGIGFERTKNVLTPGCYRTAGDVIDIYPAEFEDTAYRVSFFDDEIEDLTSITPSTGKGGARLDALRIYPQSHYLVPAAALRYTVDNVQAELEQRTAELREKGAEEEVQRLRERTLYDLEQLQEQGSCRAIENYSRYLSYRRPGEAPPCLLDFLPDDALLVIDESHVSIPQIGSMYKGDQQRVERLIRHGFRLPSARDHRPLTLEEFERRTPATLYMSATPADYELERSERIVEQLVRPTGIPDPAISVRAARTQVDDLLGEINLRAARSERVLVGALTKRMAEDLTEYLQDHGVAARYMHSDLDVPQRAEHIRDLRLGRFDVLVGINLLREGLDIPEVSLVAVLDADKEGFLRSDRSLTQTIGRAARNIDGMAILYADTVTGSMRRAIRENERRRTRQLQHNQLHGVTPRQSQIPAETVPFHGGPSRPESRSGPAREQARRYAAMPPDELEALLKATEKSMIRHAQDLEFEQAAQMRDRMALVEAALNSQRKR